ncbi:MAG: sigma-70 family RNA polymerase sigma factor [Caldimonas sp.]
MHAVAAPIPAAIPRRTAPLGTPPPAWAEIVSHRAYLVRFAQRKLRDPALAEDAVHDVFEAVLAGRAAFAGRAALRSWLTAILKHKIVDTIRRHARFDALDDETDADGALALECPLPGPHEVAEQRELLARALDRIEALPATLRDVVRMRVLDDEPTATVCAKLGISEENLFVRMHRARKHLTC